MTTVFRITLNYGASLLGDDSSSLTFEAVKYNSESKEEPDFFYIKTYRMEDDNIVNSDYDTDTKVHGTPVFTNLEMFERLLAPIPPEVLEKFDLYLLMLRKELKLKDLEEYLQ